jgi:hypothetical protein
MANIPSKWDMKQVSKWWQCGIDKERARLTNRPKPHKGDRTSVPTNFSNFAPSLEQQVEKFYARNKRKHT